MLPLDLFQAQADLTRIMWTETLFFKLFRAETTTGTVATEPIVISLKYH